MANLLTAEEITNRFLYGQATTPANLASDVWIRPTNATPPPATQDVATYMQSGGGRFAIGASFNLVQNFFAKDEVTGAYLYSLPPGGGPYTKQALANYWGINYYGLILRQQSLDDGRPDYGERAYIWNSGEFKISDSASFVVDSNGKRSITGFAVEPTGPDNFDFVSNDIIAGNLGAALQNDIDPSHIGRTVTIQFTGAVSTKTYDDTNFKNDNTYAASWSLVPQTALAGAIRAIEDQLWANGVTKFLDGDKPIIYGTKGADTLSSVSLLGHFYLGDYVKNGVVILSGPGRDDLHGSPNDDKMIGGLDNNTLFGGKGNDFLDGGDIANSILVAADGVDTVDYSGSPSGVLINLTNQDPAKLSQTLIEVANDGYGTKDTLHSIEIIKLSDQAANTVKIDTTGLPALQNLQEIDGGQHSGNVRDVLDLTLLGTGLHLRTTKSKATKRSSRSSAFSRSIPVMSL